MVSSATDVARFLDALLVRRRLLEPGTLRRMRASGPDGRYGLGLEQFSVGRSCRFWGHGGFWDGWATAGATEPTSGTTIVVLLRDADPDDASTTVTRPRRRARTARRAPLPLNRSGQLYEPFSDQPNPATMTPPAPASWQ
jgi:hypothetical protein